MYPNRPMDFQEYATVLSNKLYKQIGKVPFHELVKLFKQTLVNQSLKLCDNRDSKAAKALQLNRTTLRLIRKTLKCGEDNYYDNSNPR
jgi:hypothetical protein